MHYPIDRLQRVASTIFAAAGSEKDEADLVAEHLIEAHLNGHDSHGLIRVRAYIIGMEMGKLHPNRTVSVVTETDSILVLDGHNGYGQAIGMQANNLGIEKAKKTGMATVALRQAGHVGRLGKWAEDAADAGLASLFFVNAPRPGGAALAPFGGTDRRLNAGPIAMGMPASDGPHVILDYSTAAVAKGKVRVAKNRGEKLREACIVAADGSLTDDPNALDGPPPGALLAFGGHKGYGLCVFTDLFAGILTGDGADYEGEETEWYPLNNWMAIYLDPAKFGDTGEMARKVKKYRGWLKESPPAKGVDEVLLPGEFEVRTRAQRIKEGIDLDDQTFGQIVDAGRRVGVTKEQIDRIMAGANAV